MRKAELSLAALQIRILALGGVAIAVAALAARHVVGAAIDPAITPSGALVLAARWFVLPGLCLLAGIFAASAFRFFHRTENSGTVETQSATFEINLRYNRNTLEQLTLAGIAWAGLAASEPGRAALAFPVLAGLFVAGRIAFWLGYLIVPWARATGFLLTVLPTAVVLFMAAIKLL